MSPPVFLPEYHIVRDGWQWLIVEIYPEGPGTVLGRWSDRETAERECIRWIELAEARP